MLLVMLRGPLILSVQRYPFHFVSTSNVPGLYAGPSLCIKLLRALVRYGQPVFLWLRPAFPILFQSRLSNPATIILLWYQLHPLSVCATCQSGACPSFVLPPFLSSSPHHQLGSVWFIHPAGPRPRPCSQCALASSWVAALLLSSPLGTGQEVNPCKELRCLLHCSQVLQSLHFWSSCRC